MVIKLEIWYIMLFTFILTFLFLKLIIDFQLSRQIGQFEREEGLESHKMKKNTPIFGGVAFILSFLFAFTFLLIIKELDIIKYLLIVFPMLSFGLLGFVDDFLILYKKNNKGISANMKFLIQIIISTIYFIIYLLMNFDTKIDLIFLTLDLKFMYGIFILLAFSGFTNATNLTDGIDGLLAGIFSVILIGVFYISKLAIMKDTVAIIFSGMCAFLYFNLPKARIFMGNVGSLAIGGLFVSLAIISKQELFLFIFGLIFVIEALSVVLQVAYFKLTKGKRIFKMAPIHHHFEIVFNSEIKTLLLFYIFAIFTVVIGLFVFL